jgi:hypothetical protein
MPRSDPAITVHMAGAAISTKAGRLGGPIGNLLFAHTVPS